MRILMAHFKIKPDSLKEFETARNNILAELSHERPEGVRYTWCAMPDEQTYIGWLELEDGIENPLMELTSGKTFMRNISNWIAASPTREELRVVGWYAPQP